MHVVAEDGGFEVGGPIAGADGEDVGFFRADDDVGQASFLGA